MNKKDYSWIGCFESRKDLHKFKEDALLLFALALRFNIDDFSNLVSTALTEGGDDKKADLIHIDSEAGYAVIAQTTISADWNKPAAASNKASDLNTAVSWLLNTSIEKVPETIRPQAIELRRCINEGLIKSLQLWYVHNLPESANVKKELETVEHTVKAALSLNFPGSNSIEIQALEVGIKVIERWYTSLQRPILVSDSFEISISGGYELQAQDWRAYVTAIPIAWLYEKYKLYKDDILSANVRGYLGSRRTDYNINNAIKNTGNLDPSHFWVFNNGITALVHKFEEIKDEAGFKIKFQGISIVNGAQTTGAIGALTCSPNKHAKVQVRFIMCTTPKTIQDIVKYNNSQNRITAPDFRSGDQIQTRLIKEFTKLSDVKYLARRGGYEDLKPRAKNVLASITAGQALAAVHGAPDVAYNRKTHIWESNGLYAKYFNEMTTAKHMLFAYSLLGTIEKKKIELVGKSRKVCLTTQEEAQLSFFRERGSIILLTSAIASSVEIFIDKPTPNLFKIVFANKITLEKAISIWQPIVNVGCAFSAQLKEGLSDGLKNSEKINKAIETFRSLVESTKGANAEVFKRFSEHISLQ